MPDVAPKPNAKTGEPRPPRAPVTGEYGGDRNKSDRAKYPPAPDKRGPVLEWHQGTASTSFFAGILMSLLGIAYATLKDWGIGWMSTWWIWLLVIWPPIVMYFIGKRTGISAGSDWFAVKGGHVDTYELTKVQIVGTSGGLSWDLELADKKNTKLSVNMRDIQANRDLWDLVYNGIVHSVNHGSAKTNPRALDKLKLR